jgi:hypothetical protein
MRDIRVPEQTGFTAAAINANIEEDIREERLRLMEARGLLEQFSDDPPLYRMTAAGLQAITTEDLNQTLSNTNEKLDSTVTELENMQRSNTRSAAVQTIFSVSIIIFSVAQILNIVVENGGTLLEIGVLVAIGLILTSAVAAIGKDSIVKTVMMSL